MQPRTVKFSLLFFKSLAGLGIGIMGMIILLIFVFLGIGTVDSGSITGPFQIFAAISMGLITSMIVNSIGVFAFGLLDREKYPNIRSVLSHIISLNIFIFIFILPVYFFVAIGSNDNPLPIIFLVATLQLIISAQASTLALELSASESSRENLLAIYGIIFGILLSIILNIWIYSAFQKFSTAAELAEGGGRGPTAVLFSILPLTWFAFGFFTTAAEMFYRWIYETWGIDFLSRENV
jgi:hypothetical protein